MGSFDCYCALCSGPLSIGSISFGSSKVKDLRKRRKKIDLKKRNLEGEKCESSGDEDWEDAPEQVEGGDNIEETIEGSPSNDADDNDDDGDDNDDDYQLSSASSSSADGSEQWEDENSDLGIGDIQDVDVPPSEAKSEPDDTWSQTSELPLEAGFDPFHNTAEDDDMYEYYEEHSYDPSMLKLKDLQWIDRCRCLAFNAAATGIKKAFISGRGRYDDYGAFCVVKYGKDANDTGQDYHSCFYSYNPNDVSAFPFHEACYKILERNVGYDEKEVDLDVLYGIMKQNVKDCGRGLSVDYGGIRGVEQFWDTLPGEEYSVCDPGPRDLDEILQSMMPARLFERAPMPLDLAHRVRNDIWATLPYDILHGILEHLSTRDSTSLMTASWHVLISTRNADFWRRLLRRRVLPWFWEINSLLTKATLPSTLNHKLLYLWLDKVTTPEHGMTGPLMGIANRRRIWNVCEQLAPSYKERISPDVHIEPNDREAESIINSAISLHMPIVLYPEPKEARTISSQFIRSWNEIYYSCDLDTYWNAEGALTGIAVTFNSIQRVFGSTEGCLCQSLHIFPRDWIQSITFFISDIDMLNNEQDRSHYRTAMDVSPATDAGIRGMTVTLTSGKTKEVKSANWSSKSQRVFLVLPAMYVVGFTGQVAANGVISRIGLLQAPRPGTNTRLDPPSYTPAQKMLWASNAASLPYNSKECRPIWDHPSYSLHTFPSSTYGLQVHSDMLPHQVLIWAESASHYQYLNRISCFEVFGGMISSGNRTWEAPDIVGIWPRKTHKHGKAAHIGTGGPVPSQHPDFATCKNTSELDLHTRFTQFEEANMRHFEIDGPGGEVVNEVHVSDGAKALKIVTILGRECYWGEQDRHVWDVKKANEGELIVGLSCCFGSLGGWSWSAKTYSHWKLSAVNVVTISIGVEN